MLENFSHSFSLIMVYLRKDKVYIIHFQNYYLKKLKSMKGFIHFALVLLLATAVFSCKEKAESAVDATQNAATAEGDIYVVSPEDAKINWQASKPTSTHHGTIDIQDGKLIVKDNQVVAGSFTINLNSIKNLDLEGEYKDMLETHLKGTGEEGVDDFFNVKKFPTGTFEIVSISPSNDPNANATVKGNLTLKGISKEISIPANITVTKENVVVTTNQFPINRTDWGIVYKSKNVFKEIGDNFVDDNVYLQIMVTAKPETALSME